MSTGAWGLLPAASYRLAIKTAAVLAVTALLILAFTALSPESEAFHNYVEPLTCSAAAVLIIALVTAPPAAISHVLEARSSSGSGGIAGGHSGQGRFP